MNPSTGTFISMDKYQGTINDPISLHKYLYANANPVMYTDPTGYSSGTLAETIGTITVMDIINGIIVPNLGPALKIIAFLTTIVVVGYTVTVIPDIEDTVWGLLNGRTGVGDVAEGIRDDVISKAEENTDDKEKTKEEVKDGSTPTSPNNNQNNKKQLKEIGKNKRANKVAREHGYKSAEDFKEDFVGRDGGKFNMKYDSKTGEIYLESLQGSTQVPTGYYMK